MILRALRREHSAILKSNFAKRRSPSNWLSTSRRYNAQNDLDPAKVSTARTRNIGIIAHIDAVGSAIIDAFPRAKAEIKGKTTTTERMLYYSGHTRRLGDVDEGSTVTDFLPAERARGITIQSAAISFQWPPSPSSQRVPSPGHDVRPRSSIPHNINLIDTPGHADFTFEVVRSLRVLDGAVCILDGVAGVEAQTEKVWSQASAYQIPRIIFVNKLDRDGAAFGRTVREIGSRLGVWPAVCGIPWWSADGRLLGIGDVISLRGLRYAEGGDGKEIEVCRLQQLESQDQQLADELKKARVALVELLSEHDDEMVEKYLEADEDHLAISPEDVTESLRKRASQYPQTVVPVFAGASFRNIGVQPLLDAVVDLLPSPTERPDPDISLGLDKTTGKLAALLADNMEIAAPALPVSRKIATKAATSFAVQNLEACALAFKVVADAKRGVLVYVRVYSGVVRQNTLLWNTNLQTTERAQRLLKMYANDAVDIESIPAGQIGVIPGLKFARTGDTLIRYTGLDPKNGPPTPINSLQLKPIVVPPPVFFVSVEPNSLAEEKHIKESLNLLLREDPSLHVAVDEESGQTHLSGMGELHLEIARDRLVTDLKAKARIGSIEIGYREAVTAASSMVTATFDRDVGGKRSKAACSASVKPYIDGQTDENTHVFEMIDGNHLAISMPTLSLNGSTQAEDDAGLPESLPLRTVLQALQNGVSAALARGPTHGYPMHSTQVNITLQPEKDLFPNSTPASISSAARLACQRAIRDSAAASEPVLMEPVMLVNISVDEDSLGSVVHDLSSARGGSVLSLGSDGDENPADTINVRKIYAPPDPFAGGHALTDSSTGTMRQVVARVPLKEMVGYLKHLRSLTGGRGTFTMVVDEFERMSAQRQRALLSEIRGESWL